MSEMPPAECWFDDPNESAALDGAARVPYAPDNGQGCALQVSLCLGLAVSMLACPQGGSSARYPGKDAAEPCIDPVLCRMPTGG